MAGGAALKKLTPNAKYSKLSAACYLKRAGTPTVSANFFLFFSDCRDVTSSHISIKTTRPVAQEKVNNIIEVRYFNN